MHRYLQTLNPSGPAQTLHSQPDWNNKIPIHACLGHDRGYPLACHPAFGGQRAIRMCSMRCAIKYHPNTWICLRNLETDSPEGVLNGFNPIEQNKTSSQARPGTQRVLPRFQTNTDGRSNSGSKHWKKTNWLPSDELNIDPPGRETRNSNSCSAPKDGSTLGCAKRNQKKAIA